MTQRSEFSSAYVLIKTPLAGQAGYPCITVLFLHEPRQGGAHLVAEAFSSVYQPTKGTPEVAQRLEGCNRCTLVCIWPHHLHDHLVDEAREDLHGCCILVTSLEHLPANLQDLLAEFLTPLNAPCRMRLVDPHWQEELEGRLVGVLTKAPVKGLLGEKFTSRSQILTLSADAHTEQGLGVELARAPAADVLVNLGHCRFCLTRRARARGRGCYVRQ
mmetsp:Transcript_50763/g.105686  ORF Transcript_50763/g.105686 Transcript_50763/m.105686 type:complete len:216 (-) Transcript_50763:493-1140(-)